MKWLINQRPKSHPKGIFAGLPELYKSYERTKSPIRAKVEHVFHIVKNRFGYCKTCYRGIKKNAAQLYTLFALANVVRAGQILKWQGPHNGKRRAKGAISGK